MSFGSASVTRNNLKKDTEAKIRGYAAAYEKARDVADQSLQVNVPERTAALKASSHAKPLPSGIGFEMRSFGDESTGRAYAKYVNEGHFLRNGEFYPPNPYYSQAKADAERTLKSELSKV